MSTFPIFIIKPHKVQFRSNYSSITFHHTLINKREDVRCYVGGFKIPFSLLMSLLLSIEGLLREFKINYIISEKKIKDSKLEQFKLADDTYLCIEKNESDPMTRCIINGLVLMFRSYDFTSLTSSHEVFECLKRFTKQNKSEYILRQVIKYIVDVQTYDVLNSRKMPTILKDICKYCAKLAVDGIQEDKLNIENVYLRTTDIIAAGVEKGVHNAISVFKQKHILQPNVKLTNDIPFVLKFFREKGVLKMLHQQNPVEEVSAYASVGIVGPGGLPNKDAAQNSDRALRLSHFGSIDPVDTSEGDPGLTLYLTTGHMYDENKHSFLPISSSSNLPYILGPSASLTPYADKVDNARLLMASNQSRQTIPIITSEVPIVSSGFESMIPH
jgi:DNA-directed RNA polymerase beta subunit